MRILIAEDEPTNRRKLEITLSQSGCDVVATTNGLDALAVLLGENAPHLAILDLMMPGLDGSDVCRQVRAAPSAPAGIAPYLIMLTGNGEKESVVQGLEAGANDYLTKPFDPAELRARVQVGLQMIELQRKLADRVKELEAALSNVRQLQGLLPICSACKSIRDDQNYWQRVDTYIGAHADVQFTHGICPDCLVSLYPDLADAVTLARG